MKTSNSRFLRALGTDRIRAERNNTLVYIPGNDDAITPWHFIVAPLRRRTRLSELSFAEEMALWYAASIELMMHLPTHLDFQVLFFVEDGDKTRGATPSLIDDRHIHLHCVPLRMMAGNAPLPVDLLDILKQTGAIDLFCDEADSMTQAHHGANYAPARGRAALQTALMMRTLTFKGGEQYPDAQGRFCEVTEPMCTRRGHAVLANIDPHQNPLYGRYKNLEHMVRQLRFFRHIYEQDTALADGFLIASDAILAVERPKFPGLPWLDADELHLDMTGHSAAHIIPLDRATPGFSWSFFDALKRMIARDPSLVAGAKPSASPPPGPLAWT